jgi:2-polyprenyl-3-methyl-5-hydroxy-6-metoxy-1,4-benzoquinol methylase
VVLDYGCGFGWGSFYLSQFSKKVVGIDIDHKRIKYAQKKFAAKNIKFYTLKSFLEMKGKPLFEVICLLQVIQHVKNHKELFDNLLKIIKKGGIIIITTKKSCSDAADSIEKRFKAEPDKFRIVRRAEYELSEPKVILVNCLWRRFSGYLYMLN